jgi:glucose-1-phosphate thymidylyltransferase
MKALILAGGKGNRLRPLTSTTAKQLLPIANEPIIYYAIEKIRKAGITDIGIVISPENREEFESVVNDGSRWQVKITCIPQYPPLGLAHAVKTACEFLGDSTFLLYLGDNLFGDDLDVIVSEYSNNHSDILLVLKEVQDPRAFGVAETDENGTVIRVVEKPKNPQSNLALVGIYIFTSKIHEIISHLKPSRRGEYEITDAIQKSLEAGWKIKRHILSSWWLDTGKKEDLLQANQIILGTIPGEIKGQVDEESTVNGKIQVKTGTRIIKSTITGPVSIAENCTIYNSRINAFTSIGPGTTIKNSSLGASIILDNSCIDGIQCLSNSVIGRNVEIRQTNKDKVFFLGDHSQIEL